MFGLAELVIQGNVQRSELVLGVLVLVKTAVSWLFLGLKEALKERHLAAGSS